MKSLLMFLMAMMLVCGSAMAQSGTPKKAKAPKGVKAATVKVYGNCGMCERRIEGTLSEVPGVFSAEWDVETDMLAVQYEPKKVTLQQIKEKVASVGHDTDDVRAKDEVYDKLHGCCKYERPAKNL